MNAILKKYAELLTDYCLEIEPGEKVFIASTILGEPLVREVYKAVLQRGGHPEVSLSFREMNKIYLDEAQGDQLDYVSPLKMKMMESFDAYLVIRAPFNLREDQHNDKDKAKRRAKALKELNTLYFNRTADGSLKRSLCQFPTEASAQEAGMSLSEYQEFVFTACKLFDEDPKASWLKVRKSQQRIVDYLNHSKHIRYKNAKTDISFSVEGRTWINSDGKANMPSGEVFTGPVEDSVNGYVHFDYPSIFRGQEVRDITLEVVNGEIVKWDAGVGKTMLDHIMQIEGTRFFGEVAVGTNYDITQPTKNILFDEKIGGTIHMAIGQSYKQTGGTNQSSVHWDMIADMTDGEIFADGKRIYEKGKFIF